jgi:tRNA(Ile2) C34 agmatinyltransferase TiaS
VSALATAPLFAAPTAVEEALRGGPLTLEERLELELGAALSGRAAACPACAGPMTRAGEAEARCGDCGTALS